MKTWFRILALTSLVCFVFGFSMPQAEAGGPMNRNFGVGLSFGAPTSLTGKYYLGNDNAIDFHIGSYHHFGRVYGGGLFLAVDYLMNVWTFVDNATLKFPFYAGIGGYGTFGIGDRWEYNRHRDYYDFGIGARIPIGVALQFNSAPFEVYFELSPAVGVYFRDRGFDGYSSRARFLMIPAAIGARFYFE